jgi:hypothetical protein
MAKFRDEPRHPGPSIHRIAPVAGFAGLTFTVAAMLTFLMLPQVRWFFCGVAAGRWSGGTDAVVETPVIGSPVKLVRIT